MAASPEWLQRRLQSVGLRPVNNVVDITNYVLMQMGQPLHAFDADKLEGGIHVRCAREQEKLLALDGGTYELSDSDTVIADGSKVLAIAGVMGGEESSVTAETTQILLESAYFEPSRIRATSHRLALSSDSSYRFERGVDPRQAIGAAELATTLILELAGGTAEPEIRVAGAIPELVGEIELSHSKCCRLLGTKIPDDTIVGILSSLGLKNVGQTSDTTKWQIPSYRLDLLRPVDLIEEVARIHGLANIPATTKATASLPSSEDAAYDSLIQLKRHLVGIGFSETPTLSMVSQSQVESGAGGRDLEVLPIKNPLGTEYGMLRTTLLAGLATHELASGLLNVASRNANLGAPSVRIFEAGTVYSTTSERTVLSLLIAGNATELSWMTPRPRSLSIHDMRGVIESFLRGAPLHFEMVAEGQLPLLADLSVESHGEKLALGCLGQLAPSQSRRIGYETVLVAELRFETIARVLAEPRKHQDISPYPAIARDVAMEIDADVSNQTVSDFFASCKEHLLESYMLFDVFSDPSGKKLDPSKKSLAYSLTYRSKDTTLESSAVDKAHAKILAKLQDTLGVSIR